MSSIDDCPAELRVCIQEFWPESEWNNAASVAQRESGWDAFAKNDTATRYGCGTPIGTVDGVPVVAERSIGYFQVNSCNYPGWEWERLYNARHNAGTAHMIWTTQGWRAWFFSARVLGLIA